jgi:amino acid transporter
MSRRAGRLGWFLVWGVVFCDIGTSVYYVPGLLYRSVGDLAGFFVVLTILAFVLLCVKVLEVTRRFPGGGGVVSVADHAFGPWWGALGGQLILVDYFLTVAISAVSGVYYVDTFLQLEGGVVPLTLGCLLLLGLVNVVGVKESAKVSAVLAVAALIVDAGVIAAAFLHAPPEVIARIPREFVGLADESPTQFLVGYAGAWLAFSGLESLSQLAPAMRDLTDTPRRALIAVIVSVVLTSPVLTVLAVASLPPEIELAHGERFIAELGLVWGGKGLQVAVVLTAAAALLFAANTAVIGSYHVQMALARRQMAPAAVGALSQRFQTPSIAIAIATLVPALVLVVTGGDIVALGGLYAFGLLGSFLLTSAGVDVLRWRDGERGRSFVIGLFTTALVAIAFVVNLVAKPHAAAFGGGLAAFGMLLAVAVHNGWIERIIAHIPRLAPPEVVVRGSELPILTVAQAAALQPHISNGILVASRGATRKIFREAVDRAHARGHSRVFVAYVDEVPGMFYPQLAAPTAEGLTVLDAGCSLVRELGGDPVPVWGISHSAAAMVVEIAEELSCDTLVIGATQRTFLWHALRGQFIQELRAALPPEIRLIVVG